jgi:hypothetical protein
MLLKPMRSGCVGIPMHHSADRLLWPRWASWALAAVVLTSLLTIAATINDIW